MLSLRQAQTRLANLPARVALRWCNLPRVRHYLAARHEQALARHSPNLEPLSEFDAKNVERLKSDGVAVTDLEALGLHAETRAVIATARQLGVDYALTANRRARAGKQFHHVPSNQICANREIYQLGLHPLFLDIAEAYLGVPVGYDGAMITYTVADGQAASTRRWHRDWEDRSTLKVLIYLMDVTAQDGPFQLIPFRDPHQNDANGFRYDVLPEAELDRMLGAGAVKSRISVEGVTGTITFADTARYFHRGAPAEQQDRIALFFSYFAARPRHPFMDGPPLTNGAD